MAEPVDSSGQRARRRAGVVAAACALVLAVAVAITAAVVTTSGSGETDRGASVAGLDHGTVPTHLDAAAVGRIGRAFGIRARPERTAAGWEVEDTVRALYLARTASAWYAQFTDSSALLHPEGDRTTICASPTPPQGCSVPTVRFVADVGEHAPAASAAVASARGILERAEIIDRRWSDFVIGPSPEPVPCRGGVAPGLDCTRQVLATQSVMLTRELGPSRTAFTFAVVVGPGDEVLSATGRFGRPDTD